MRNNISFSKKGFTLIELLVVISIIGLLASVVLVSFPTSTKKTRDSIRMQELKQIQTALRFYYDIHHQMPINRNPGFDYCDNQANFLQELVDTGLWPYNPKDPGGSHYCYYDYGPDNSIGALLVVTLESYSGTEGIPGSCRPWAPGVNWCSKSDNSYYCLCTPYSPYW